MTEAERYLKLVLEEIVDQKIMPHDEVQLLPLFIREAYSFSIVGINGHEFILADLHEDVDFNSIKIDKTLQQIVATLNKKVILGLKSVSSISRKRLIDKKINFIVPDKQMFLPDLLIDLNERFPLFKERHKTEKLIPSAQLILLYHLLQPTGQIPLSELSYKLLAIKFDYTQMAISMAAENLQNLGLCIASGKRGKKLQFIKDKTELWEKASPYLISPVLKKVYVDDIPEVPYMDSNLTALPAYSNMNPSRQRYIAIEKNIYYPLTQNEGLVNENDIEGLYCMEVWKYDPIILGELITDKNIVDPLSLYLSLRDEEDERIEMALDQIIKKFIW